MIERIAGVPQQTPTTPVHKTVLDQRDFLALLAAQLKNQDPTKPADNAEYVSQLAQFSQVSGLSEIGRKLDTLIAATVDAKG